MNRTKRHTLGRTERVDLPLWRIQNIEAKIDTGAFTSSVHCHHIEEVNKENATYIQFNLLDPEHPAYNEQLFVLPVHDKREVKSSNGQTELRYFVKTTIELFGKEYDIELSLTDRSEMKFPILIGRKFVRRHQFLVDVTKKNQSLKNRS